MTGHRDQADDLGERLERAVRAREDGRHEEARTLLLALRADHPDDATVAYQTAWVHDALGLEREAVPHYERALAGEGLTDAERQGALVGLGSTYRVVGRHDDAVATLRAGVAAYPDHGALRTFLALALHSTGRHTEATGLLLTLLAETSADPGITAYRRAIARYAEDPDRTW
ncbi:tetratricopeptide repeat protein [Streptomyces sp. RFCAC02]|uniref:tetratricopeptide repeat protein n=1 Tax=Streptomyces sp. RFCAC02 TaxID=2499143 RepID=UPI001F10F86C|nr:tetratricopeptide repeat protein [Streptomyces sp. RFCAC02]